MLVYAGCNKGADVAVGATRGDFDDSNGALMTMMTQ